MKIEQEIIDLYYQKLITVTEIAKRYNIHRKTVYNAFASQNIKLLGSAQSRTKDILPGTKFAYLTVLKQVLNKTKHTGAMYLCVCECGKTRECRGQVLRSGNITSCGCKRGAWGYKGYKLLSGTYIAAIKNSARQRQLDFNLDNKFLWELFEKQNHKCALSGVDIVLAKPNDLRNQTASLDRIDSNIGYIENNVQWLHKDVNNMKQALTDTKFIEWCSLIYEYNNRL